MITLLTDFGLADPYVAQIKGVIRSVNPQIEIVDISHGIEKHNISMGSYVLETTVGFFPKETIHLAVVDPGVGGTRLPIVVACEWGVLVGPDNGLLGRASDKLSLRGAFRITGKQFVRKNLSSTFHARDIFAYTAAQLAQGTEPGQVGPRLDAIVRLNIREPKLARGLISCTVLYVDSFGNIVTNISEDESFHLAIDKAADFRIATKRETHRALRANVYSELSRGELGILWGSQGYLEIATREASAANRLSVRASDRLKIYFK